jgi:hypothetical protein
VRAQVRRMPLAGMCQLKVLFSCDMSAGIGRPALCLLNVCRGLHGKNLANAWLPLQSFAASLSDCAGALVSSAQASRWEAARSGVRHASSG